MARKLYLGLFGLVLIGLVVVAVSRLIGAAVYLRQGRLDSALIGALARRDVPLAKSLLEQGANANARERLDHPRGGWKGLWDEVSGHRSRPEFGMHALFIAEENDDIPATSALLKQGADPNTSIPAEDGFKVSVLMRAAGRGKYEIVQMLVEHGADVKFNIGSDLSTLDMIRFCKAWGLNGQTNTPAAKRFERTIEILKQAGAH
jgi:ankyrin repeat protein